MKYLVRLMSFTFGEDADVRPREFLWLDERSPSALSRGVATGFACFDDADYAAWSVFDETTLPDRTPDFPTRTDPIWWPSECDEDPADLSGSGVLARVLGDPLFPPERPRPSDWDPMSDSPEPGDEFTLKWHAVFIDPRYPNDRYLGAVIQSLNHWRVRGIMPKTVSSPETQRVSARLRHRTRSRPAIPPVPTSVALPLEPDRPPITVPRAARHEPLPALPNTVALRSSTGSAQRSLTPALSAGTDLLGGLNADQRTTRPSAFEHDTGALPLRVQQGGNTGPPAELHDSASPIPETRAVPTEEATFAITSPADAVPDTLSPPVTTAHRRGRRANAILLVVTRRHSGLRNRQSLGTVRAVVARWWQQVAKRFGGRW